jgi:hypothetical protein
MIYTDLKNLWDYIRSAAKKLAPSWAETTDELVARAVARSLDIAGPDLDRVLEEWALDGKGLINSSGLSISYRSPLHSDEDDVAWTIAANVKHRLGCSRLDS